ncbi:MAG: hypothetical protein ACM3UR_16135, partial [Bacteroidota bacterium]
MTSISKALVLLVMLLLVGFTIIHKELGDNKTGQSAGIKELSNNTQTQTAVKQESSFIQFLDKG